MISEEIIEKLPQVLETPYDFYNNDIPNDIFGDTEIVKTVEETDGTAYVVVLFKDHGVFIRLNGYYDSYDSYATYDDHDYVEVFPYQEMVTFYDTNKK